MTNFPRNNMPNSKTTKNLFKNLFLKLTMINDTPQKISLGLGLGVFLGIMPGTGPIAALVLGQLLRLNLASALLGGILTNTWLSIVTFPLSVWLASVILKVKADVLYSEWLDIIKNHHWSTLFRFSAIKIIYPIVFGSFVVALIFGSFTFIIFFLLLKKAKRHES